VDPKLVPDNPYLLLTPGPLSTSKRVRATLLRDWCTWDADYKTIVQRIRSELVALATRAPGYTSVLMQGSGTFGVEAVIGTEAPPSGGLLVLVNGAYGARIAQIARRMGIECQVQDSGETRPPDLEALDRTLAQRSELSHVAMVHCETTTGMLNPAREVGGIVRRHGRKFVLDAMSSFGGIEFDQAELGAAYLISSANKCIQGIPGFSFVVAEEATLAATKGRSRSLSLDLFDQWRAMEDDPGKWRFTSPTHAVRGFAEALAELRDEGGVAVRAARYRANHRTLVDGLRGLGFRTLLPDGLQSPIITAFHYPEHPEFRFDRFYALMKGRGFVIYPGKVSHADTFRIGHIGDVRPADLERLVEAVRASMYWA
jgi:2-aminoethylphosphonate-pyruvate transaminase